MLQLEKHQPAAAGPSHPSGACGSSAEDEEVAKGVRVDTVVQRWGTKEPGKDTSDPNFSVLLQFTVCF